MVCTNAPFMPKHKRFRFLRDFIYFHLFLERREGREREREGGKHRYVRETLIGCLSHAPWPGHNPGMCPDWESNQRPFTLCNNTQSTERYRSVPAASSFFFLNFHLLIFREREASICCSTSYAFIAGSCMCQHQTPNLGISGWRSNQLSCLARAQTLLDI